VGANLAALGLVYGVAVSLIRGQGFPVGAMLAVVLGVLLCMLGLIADQISQLRMERIRATPVTVIEDTAELSAASPSERRVR
jgi:hypothetical protein